MIIYVFIPFFTILIGLLICCLIYMSVDDKRRKQELEYLEKTQENQFSVTEYYNRIEQESIKLSERKCQYLIVLWWGNDGLRLNEDGTTEWINRKPAPTTTPQVDYSICNTRITQSGLQSTICDIEHVIQSQRLSLQAQQIQAMQSI